MESVFYGRYGELDRPCSPLAIESFEWADDRAWAAQCVERQGKFYWYVCLHSKLTGAMAIGVAVGDSPVGLPGCHRETAM